MTETAQNSASQWAMVTGASRGIGREVALALADAGLNVVVASRDLAGTSDLVAQLHGKGVEAFAVATDLSDPDAVRALAAEVTNKVDISLLYNNAGVQAP